MIIYICLLSSFSALIGYFLIFLPNRYRLSILSFTFGISAVLMFLISIKELIPQGLNLIYNKLSINYIFLLSFLILFLGYITVKILNSLFSKYDSLYRVGVISCISMLIHNIPEGIICVLTSSYNIKLGVKICILMMLHNIPEGMCISIPIYYASNNKFKSFVFLLGSVGGELLGAIISFIFFKNYINIYILYFIYIYTAGIMITLSIFDLLIDGFKKYFSFMYILGIVVGLLIGFII